MVKWKNDFFMFGRYKVGQVDPHDGEWARSISMMMLNYFLV